jgi:hypothetical protein
MFYVAGNMAFCVDVKVLLLVCLGFWPNPLLDDAGLDDVNAIIF